MAASINPSFQKPFIFQPAQDPQQDARFDISQFTLQQRQSYEQFRKDWDQAIGEMQISCLQNGENYAASKLSLRQAVLSYVRTNPYLTDHVKNVLRVIIDALLKMSPVDDNNVALIPQAFLAWIQSKLDVAFKGKLVDISLPQQPALQLRAEKASRVARANIKSVTKTQTIELSRARRTFVRSQPRRAPVNPSMKAVEQLNLQQEPDQNKQIKKNNLNDNFFLPVFSQSEEIISQRLLEHIEPLAVSVPSPVIIPQSFAPQERCFRLDPSMMSPEEMARLAEERIKARNAPAAPNPSAAADQPQPPQISAQASKQHFVNIFDYTDDIEVPTPKASSPLVAPIPVASPTPVVNAAVKTVEVSNQSLPAYPTSKTTPQSSSPGVQKLNVLIPDPQPIPKVAAAAKVEYPTPQAVSYPTKPSKTVSKVTMEAQTRISTQFAAITKTQAARPIIHLTAHAAQRSTDNAKRWFGIVLKDIWNKKFGENLIHALMQTSPQQRSPAFLLRILFIGWAQKTTSAIAGPEIFAHPGFRPLQAKIGMLTLPGIAALIANNSGNNAEFNGLRNAINAVIAQVSVPLDLFADMQGQLDQYRTVYIGLKEIHAQQLAEKRQKEEALQLEATKRAFEKLKLSVLSELPPELYPGSPRVDLSGEIAK